MQGLARSGTTWILQPDQALTVQRPAMRELCLGEVCESPCQAREGVMGGAIVYVDVDLPQVTQAKSVSRYEYKAMERPRCRTEQ